MSLTAPLPYALMRNVDEIVLNMNAESALYLSYALALAGLVCFLWPVVANFRHSIKQEEPSFLSRSSFRSPWRWAGFGLTLAALLVQRIGFTGG
jgi:hypothetical protein